MGRIPSHDDAQQGDLKDSTALVSPCHINESHSCKTQPLTMLDEKQAWRTETSASDVLVSMILQSSQSSEDRSEAPSLQLPPMEIMAWA